MAPQAAAIGLSDALLVILFLVSVSAQAQQTHATLQYGDILAGGQTQSVIGFAFGRFDWFLPDGTLNLRLADTFDELPSDVALDRTNKVYWPTFYTIRVFGQQGAYVDTFPNYAGLVFTMITFDRAGNAYTNPPYAQPGNLAKVTSEGNLITTYSLPTDGVSGGGGVSVDIAADQCTAYYTSASARVYRYDLCGRAPLPDLISGLPGVGLAGGVRILPDRGALVTNEETVLRVSHQGQVVRVYDVAGENGWQGLALDVDRTSFWATSRNTAFKFDIESGAVLDSFQSSDYLFNAITVVGEPKAALAGPDIPTLSEWALLALALGLAGVAVVRIGTMNG